MVFVNGNMSVILSHEDIADSHDLRQRGPDPPAGS